MRSPVLDILLEADAAASEIGVQPSQVRLCPLGWVIHAGLEAEASQLGHH